MQPYNGENEVKKSRRTYRSSLTEMWQITSVSYSQSSNFGRWSFITAILFRMQNHKNQNLSFLRNMLYKLISHSRMQLKFYVNVSPFTTDYKSFDLYRSSCEYTHFGITVIQQNIAQKHEVQSIEKNLL